MGVLSKLEVKLEMFEDSDKFNKEHSINFLSFYAPTIALYIVEMFVPSFFGYLNQKQMYLQRTKLKLQILRKTILDIFSTYTYIVAVLQIKKCDSVDVCNVGRIGCMRLLCWENMLAQAVYKKNLVDMASLVFRFFFVNTVIYYLRKWRNIPLPLQINIIEEFLSILGTNIILWLFILANYNHKLE